LFLDEEASLARYLAYAGGQGGIMAALKSSGRAPWWALAAIVAVIWLVSWMAWLMMNQS
jgi:hypothetical protein